MSKKMVFLLVCFLSFLTGRSALAQGVGGTGFPGVMTPQQILGQCLVRYFANDRTPSFANQIDLNSAWDLPGLWCSGSGPGECGGNFDTNPAGLNVDATDCGTWDWIHLINAFAGTMVIYPNLDPVNGHHFDGDPVTDPISYCPHSNVTYVIFGRSPIYGTVVLGFGQKWGLPGTGANEGGPCGGSSVDSFPCGPDYPCGNNFSIFDTNVYPEVWVGVITWSHDHKHFFGGDPYTNVWWNSLIEYQLER